MPTPWPRPVRPLPAAARPLAAVAALLLPFGAAACGEDASPDPTSEQHSDESPSTSSAVPPGNPPSGGTGTQGNDTGG